MDAVLRFQARYHAWASATLARHVAAVGDAASSPLPCLFFHTIDDTLAHVVAAESLWRHRMGFPDAPSLLASSPADGPDDATALTPRWQSPAAPGVWASAYSDVPAAVSASSKRLAEVVEDLAAADRVAGSFRYATTDGAPKTAMYTPVLVHVFQHAVHHRGQVTAALQHLGAATPALDAQNMPPGAFVVD